MKPKFRLFKTLSTLSPINAFKGVGPILITVVLGAHSAQAATLSDTTGTITWDLNATAAWTGSTVKWTNNADTAKFDISGGGTGYIVTINDVTGGQVGAAGITFGNIAGNWIFNGNTVTDTLQIGSGGIAHTITNGTNGVTFNVPLVLTASQTWTLNSARPFVISGGISTLSGTTNLTFDALNTAGTSNGAPTPTLKMPGTNTFSGAMTVKNNGLLSLDYTTNNTSKLEDVSGVILQNTGALLLTTNVGTNTTEVVNTLAFDAGNEVITLASAAGRVTTLSVAAASNSFSRSNNATALVRGTNLNQSAGSNVSRISFGDAGTSLSLVGGAALLNSGATNDSTKGLKIVPYLIGDTSTTGTGSHFVTYDSTLGLRVLLSTEETTLVAGSTTSANPENALAGANVTLTGAALTVNSLLFNSASGSTLNSTPANELTVNSGAVASVVNQTNAIGSGFSKLNLDNSEGVVTVTQGSLTISTPVDVTSGGTHLTSGGVLTKSGGGTLVLGASILYSGATTVNQGTLQVGTATTGDLGSNTAGIALNGGTLSFGRTNTVLTVSNTISGSGGVTQNGTGGTTILSVTNSYSGGTTISQNGGILKITNAGALGSGAVVNATTNTATSQGTLQLDFTTPPSGVGSSTSNPNVVANAFNLGGQSGLNGGGFPQIENVSGFNRISGAITFSNFGGTWVNITSDAGNLELSGAVSVGTGLTGTRNFDFGGAGNGSVSGVVSNGFATGAVQKDGAGTWTFSNANTYTGPVDINGGTLVASRSNNTTNPTSSALGNPRVVRNINVNNGGTLKFSQGDTFGGATTAVLSTLVINSGGIATNTAGFFTTLGPVTLNGGTLTGNNGAINGFQMYNLLGTITVGGSVASTISGPAAGGTTFGGYHLAATATGTTFNVADVISGSAVDLTVSGTLINTSNTLAAAGLIKTGAGTMLLSSANTYTGSTAINAGTLALGASGSIASTTVSVAAGAVLDTTAKATYTLPAALTLGIDGTSGTSGKINATGQALVINGSAVTFNVTGTLTAPAYVLATYGSISGTATFGSIVGSIPTGYTINYAYNSGTQIALVKSGYDSWTSSFLLTGADALPGADPDNDGIKNQLEYVLGGNPTVSSQSILPVLDASGANFVFTFNRGDDSETDTTQAFEYGNDLIGWTDVTIGAVSSGPDGNGVTVGVVENGTSPDAITVTVPKGTNPKLFGRLQVVK